MADQTKPRKVEPWTILVGMLASVMNANVPISGPQVAPITEPSPVVNPGPGRCPRHARRAAVGGLKVRTWLTARDLHHEPFRLFFPIAALAGLVGITLWPLMLGGWMEEYPGSRHARLMILGFFGAFIFGFLGTSMPRLLETTPLRLSAVLVQAGLHVVVTGIYTLGSVQLGDGLFTLELGLWMVLLGSKFPARKDLPPPGFVLVPLAFLSAVAGLALDGYGRSHELPPGADVLFRLLTYHNFILLCILGAGSFLLPRFLGLGVRQKFETSRTPPAGWLRAAGTAAAAGVVITATCFLEAWGWPRTGTLLRAGVVGAFLWSTMPLERLRWTWQGVQWLLVVGLACVPIGIVAAGFWPGWRAGLSHIELVGGFALITVGVATRVIFGHSGHRAKLERFHPWLTTAGVLMLLGLLSRLSGEVLPSTMVSHYIYGVVCWGAGLLIWIGCVLAKVLTPDPEAD